MKNSKENEYKRRPLADLDSNKMFSRNSLYNVNNKEELDKVNVTNLVRKGANIYENLMKKTKDLQNDLNQMKSGLLKEGGDRKRCNSFISFENSSQPSQNLKEKGKLIELNENLVKNNAFLMNKIKLMEEREQILLKTIDQLRCYPRNNNENTLSNSNINNNTKKDSIRSGSRDELIKLFSKY